MLIFGGIPTLILLGIIITGAYHCWMGVTHLLSKPFHQTEERHIKKWSGIIIGVSILLMAAPLIIPSSMGFKEIIGVLYIVYGGTALSMAYNAWTKRGQAKNDQAKDDKNGK
jgi:uncharacterized membrane protein YkvI